MLAHRRNRCITKLTELYVYNLRFAPRLPPSARKKAHIISVSAQTPTRPLRETRGEPAVQCVFNTVQYSKRMFIRGTSPAIITSQRGSIKEFNHSFSFSHRDVQFLCRVHVHVAFRNVAFMHRHGKESELLFTDLNTYFLAIK